VGEESLGLRSFKGVLWNVFGSVANQAMGFAMGIVLARMIAPESYGLIAMSMVVIGMTAMLVDGGFTAALIQKKTPTEADYHTVFWFNLLVSITVYGGIYFAAPIIELFFETTGLINVVQLLALNIIINGVTAVQRLQLIKKLDFKALNIMNTIATFLSGVIGVTMALLDYGVWALVAQQLSSSIFNSVFIIVYNRWMPALLFSKKSFLELWSFGSKLFASSILNSIFTNIYPLIIGKLFTPALLAYYSRADSYQKLLSQTLTSIVQRVSFPALVPLQDDNERLKNAYRQMIRMVMLVNAPALLGLMATASPLIEFMITDKWLPTVPYLQWLCVAGLLYPLHAINLNVINVKGRSDIFLKLEIIKKGLVLIAIFAGLPWGVMGLVVASVMVGFVGYFLNTYYSIRLIGYTMKEQFWDIIPYLSLAAVMAIVVWGLSLLIVNSLGLLLLAQLIIGFGIYAGGCLIFKLNAWVQFRDLIGKVIGKG